MVAILSSSNNKWKSLVNFSFNMYVVGEERHKHNSLVLLKVNESLSSTPWKWKIDKFVRVLQGTLRHGPPGRKAKSKGEIYTVLELRAQEPPSWIF